MDQPVGSQGAGQFSSGVPAHHPQPDSISQRSLADTVHFHVRHHLAGSGILHGHLPDRAGQHRRLPLRGRLTGWGRSGKAIPVCHHPRSEIHHRADHDAVHHCGLPCVQRDLRAHQRHGWSRRRGHHHVHAHPEGGHGHPGQDGLCQCSVTDCPGCGRSHADSAADYPEGGEDS